MSKAWNLPTTSQDKQEKTTHCGTNAHGRNAPLHRKAANPPAGEGQLLSFLPLGPLQDERTLGLRGRTLLTQGCASGAPRDQMGSRRLSSGLQAPGAGVQTTFA